MSELPKLDGGFVAAVTFLAVSIWGAIASMFATKNKIVLHDLKLDAHDKRMEEIEAHMEDAHVDLKATMVRTEQKLDRLIERFLPYQKPEGNKYES